MRKELLLILLLVGVLMIGIPIHAQDTPPQINLALADLAARLQKSVTLDNLTSWTFAQSLYTDTALGCSLVTGTAAPQGISAYTFKLDFEGITYEYRVSVDGQIVFPCDSGLLQKLIPTPSGEVRQCPTGYTGYLPPRLRVNSQGRVQEGGAPNRLRSAPNTDAEQIGVINPGRTFDIIGGPSCDESNYVWWQVVIDGQVGWTAEGVLPDEYYLEPIDTTTSAPVMMVTSAPQQLTPMPLSSGNDDTEPDVPVFAAVTDKELTLYGLSEDKSLTEQRTLGELSIVDMIWSPDGRYLAYAALDENFVSSLFVQHVTVDTSPIQIATGFYLGMGINFTSDSNQIIYGVQSQTANNSDPQQQSVDILIQGILTHKAPARLGTVTIGIGCGGESSFPADTVVAKEAGSRTSILELTPLGLVYTNNCTGSGTSLLDLRNNQTVELGINLSRVDVSPDGKQVVGLADSINPSQPSVLTIVNLEALEQIPLGTIAIPSQVAWGPNNEIYYSTVSVTGEIIHGSDTPLVAQALGIPSILENEVAIHLVNLEETSDTELYRGDAYSIGRLYAAPNGESLFFSTIPNAESLVNTINDDSLVAVDLEQAASLLPVSLYHLSPQTGQTILIGEDMAQAAFNDAAFISDSAG